MLETTIGLATAFLYYVLSPVAHLLGWEVKTVIIIYLSGVSISFLMLLDEKMVRTQLPVQDDPGFITMFLGSLVFSIFWIILVPISFIGSIADYISSHKNT